MTRDALRPRTRKEQSRLEWTALGIVSSTVLVGGVLLHPARQFLNALAGVQRDPVSNQPQHVQVPSYVGGPNLQNGSIPVRLDDLVRQSDYILSAQLVGMGYSQTANGEEVGLSLDFKESGTAPQPTTLKGPRLREVSTDVRAIAAVKGATSSFYLPGAAVAISDLDATDNFLLFMRHSATGPKILSVYTTDETGNTVFAGGPLQVSGLPTSFDRFQAQTSYAAYSQQAKMSAASSPQMFSVSPRPGGLPLAPTATTRAGSQSFRLPPSPRPGPTLGGPD